MIDSIKVTGLVVITKTDASGLVLSQEEHNIVTTQGDQLIADGLCLAPARQKIDSTHGFMVVGTGWTGASPKSNSWVNTQVGNAQALAATFPKLQGSWGQLNGNVVWYESIFPAGSLNASNVNEIALVTAATPGISTSCLAYAQITPTVTMTLSDTLQIDWFLAVSGS
jgi:hypothetical protein